MAYTVRQLAKVAGVSVRTLHYYDQIGLLKPSCIRQNGYREYGEDAVILLQQILFFRELGFRLEDIRSIVASPGFDVREALESHRALLEKKAERLAELIGTVDRTIRRLEGGTEMQIKDYYRGFSDEQIEEYRKEVRQRWGEETLRKSEARVTEMGKDGFAAHQAKGDVIFKTMAGLMNQGPDNPQVQEQVAAWREWLEAFSSYSDEAVLGLGRMYSEDSRFAAFFAKYDSQLPAFMTQAIEYFCAHKAS